MKKKSPLEIRRQKRAEAMPLVKKLVARFGRQTIANCIGQLKEKEKAAKKVEALKKELARLERIH